MPIERINSWNWLETQGQSSTKIVQKVHSSFEYVHTDRHSEYAQLQIRIRGGMRPRARVEDYSGRNRHGLESLLDRYICLYGTINSNRTISETKSFPGDAENLPENTLGENDEKNGTTLSARVPIFPEILGFTRGMV